MPKLQVDFDNIGKEHGRPDIERIGVFIEAPYLNGKGYVSPFGKVVLFKGKNMLSDGRKIKCGTQDAYFDKEFKRLFEGEPWKTDKKKDKLKIPFMPTGPGKWRATPGDYYGCFSGNIEAFSNVRRPTPKYQRQAANFLTNPVKQGGSGYADICLSKYPEHIADPYMPKLKPTKDKLKPKGPPMITCHYPKPYFDLNPYLDPKGKIGPTYIRPKEKVIASKGTFIPTGPGKWPGGSHQGCFSPFPEWTSSKARKPEKKLPKAFFYPQSMALKTMFTNSIVHAYTDVKVNVKNNHTYEPSYTTHLLD